MIGTALGGVLLARHGQTDDNLEPYRFQGFADTPLNDTGRRQAHELAARIPAGGVRSLWASDLSRARETAEIVGAAIDLQPALDARLREGDRGAWEGRLMIDAQRDDPERFAAWLRAGPEFRFPGGESLAEHQARVLACLRDVHAAGPLPALVVCHGGSIRGVLCSRDPRGLDAFHEPVIGNAAVVAL
ncbi:MAG: histidine phosphatase family protein [Solirubrobacteraceae bacterium]